MVKKFVGDNISSNKKQIIIQRKCIEKKKKLLQKKLKTKQETLKKYYLKMALKKRTHTRIEHEKKVVKIKQEIGK